MYVPNTSINITALISFCLYIHTTVPIEVTAPIATSSTSQGQQGN